MSTYKRSGPQLSVTFCRSLEWGQVLSCHTFFAGSRLSVFAEGTILAEGAKCSGISVMLKARVRRLAESRTL